MPQTPLISVCIITYNQELYVAQTIESILEQECNVPFEIIIGEDVSTDTTRSICERYASEYPELIRLLPSDRNWGVGGNLLRTFRAAKGKYLAICEGDDYWTYPQKLQEQLDHFERHPDSSMVYTNNVDYWEDSGEITPCIWPDFNIPETIDLEYVLKRNWFIRTATIMFRRDVVDMLPPEYDGLYNTDYLLHLYSALFGPIRRIPNLESMAVYRHHPTGISNNSKLQVKVQRHLRYLWQLIPICTAAQSRSVTKAAARHCVTQFKSVAKLTSRSALPGPVLSLLKTIRAKLKNV